MSNGEAELSRARRWPWVAAGVLAVLGLAAVALTLRFRDTETPVSVTEALERFESDAAPTPVPTEQPEQGQVDVLPSPGVYVYSTAGGEEIDALGGTRHDYPRETALTVRTGGCGVVLTWQPLEERFEEWELCLRDGSLTMPSYTAFHRFFGTDDRQDFLCEPAIVLIPRLGAEGSDSATCETSRNLVETVQVTVLAREVLTVGTSEVEAVGLEFEIASEGSAHGTTSAEMWISTETGAVVRWSETVESVSTSLIGDVTYAEQFDMQLTMLEPVQ